MSKLYELMTEHVNYVSNLESTLGWARHHLKPYLNDMDAKNLLCMIGDSIFYMEDYPEDALRRIIEAEGEGYYGLQAAKLLEKKEAEE